VSGGIDVDLDRLEEVASRLDLRKPNREALESLAFEMSQHFDVDGRPPTAIRVQHFQPR
jgi:type III restriction enzyme